MKIRNDFVTNSSSTSYIFIYPHYQCSDVIDAIIDTIEQYGEFIQIKTKEIFPEETKNIVMRAFDEENAVKAFKLSSDDMPNTVRKLIVSVLRELASNNPKIYKFLAIWSE